MSNNLALAIILSSMAELSRTDLEAIMVAARHRLDELHIAENSAPEIKVAASSLVQEYTRCGKHNCKCTRGEPHGPYWYKYVYKEGGGQRRIYIGKKKPAT